MSSRSLKRILSTSDDCVDSIRHLHKRTAVLYDHLTTAECTDKNSITAESTVPESTSTDTNIEEHEMSKIREYSRTIQVKEGSSEVGIFDAREFSMVWSFNQCQHLVGECEKNKGYRL